MKIGIYNNDLDSLLFLKTLVKKLPDYDYELHIDTSYLNSKTQDQKTDEVAQREGVEILLNKGVGLIFNLSKSELRSQIAESVKIVKISEISDLKKYLENNPEVEKLLSRNQTRNIFLTENSTETDKMIEVMLGGTLIRE